MHDKYNLRLNPCRRSGHERFVSMSVLGGLSKRMLTPYKRFGHERFVPMSVLRGLVEAHADPLQAVRA